MGRLLAWWYRMFTWHEPAAEPGRSEPTTVQPWIGFRCRNCRGMLCRISAPQIMRDNEAIEFKCHRCKQLTYLAGEGFKCRS